MLTDVGQDDQPGNANGLKSLVECLHGEYVFIVNQASLIALVWGVWRLRRATPEGDLAETMVPLKMFF